MYYVGKYWLPSFGALGYQIPAYNTYNLEVVFLDSVGYNVVNIRIECITLFLAFYSIDIYSTLTHSNVYHCEHGSYHVRRLKK